ncbi:MAG: transcriptional repressor [Lachnospiraceae bacterium]|nr:transcriptional repressor [Lachnospiraceae bacterium]
MKTLKYSRQRESIVNFLATRKDHPTADVIYEHIRMEQPNISLGTVYRNLALLADLGAIQKLSYGIGPDHFDGNAMPHYHFVCTECGAVSDLDIDDMPDISTVASRNFKGTITGYCLHFLGKCPHCTTVN